MRSSGSSKEPTARGVVEGSAADEAVPLLAGEEDLESGGL